MEEEKRQLNSPDSEPGANETDIPERYRLRPEEMFSGETKEEKPDEAEPEWLRELGSEGEEDLFRFEDAENAVPAEESGEENGTAAAAEAPAAFEETAEPAAEESAPVTESDEPYEPIPMPKQEHGFFSAANFPRLRELLKSRKKTLKTPNWYDGEGKDKPFRINVDFANEYPSPVRQRAVHRAGMRKTGWFGGILYFLFIICVSAGLAAIGWLFASDALAMGKPKNELEITVPDDFTLESVTEQLFSAGVIRYPKLFQFYGKYSHAEDKIDPGTYIIKTNFDYRALVVGLSDYGGEQIEVEVMIPEGYTLDEIFAKLEENGVCTAAKLRDAAASYVFDYSFLPDTGRGDPYVLEGFLFPDTYKFFLSDDPVRVIKKFLDDFEYRFDEELQERCLETGVSLKDAVILASIIEKEASGSEDRKLVSSVLHNRLNEGMWLQLDSTVYYACARVKVDFNIDLVSPYNTYMRGGLPEGPISNPGLAAIKAALYPEETEYLYFLSNAVGETVFFTNYEDFAAYQESEEYTGG